MKPPINEVVLERIVIVSRASFLSGCCETDSCSAKRN